MPTVRMGRVSKQEEIVSLLSKSKSNFSSITTISVVFVMLLIGYHGFSNYTEAKQIQTDEKNEALKCLNRFKQLDCIPDKINPGSECEDLLKCLENMSED